MIAMHLARMHRLLPGTLVLLVACTLAAPARADEADDLFDKGNAAYDAGKYEEALAHFTAVWKRRKTHDLAATMAQAEIKLGRHAAAAEHLTYALAHFPLTAKPEVREQMETVFADVKKKVAKVRVQLNVKDAALTVDGVRVDPVTEDGDLFLSPGQRMIEVSAAGHASVRRTIDAVAGETRELVFTLVAVEQEPTRSMLLPSIAFGGGGAGLVMGAIAAGVTAAKTADLKRVCGDALQCPPSERANLDGATTAAHVSTVGFILFGVGAAAGVTLLVVPIVQKPKTQSVVVAGPGFVGVKGSF